MEGSSLIQNKKDDKYIYYAAIPCLLDKLLILPDKSFKTHLLWQAHLTRSLNQSDFQPQSSYTCCCWTIAAPYLLICRLHTFVLLVGGRKQLTLTLIEKLSCGGQHLCASSSWHYSLSIHRSSCLPGHQYVCDILLNSGF